MKMTILGLKRIDFTDEESGREVKGVSIHGHYYDPAMTGQCTKPVFISDKALSGIGFPIPESSFDEFIGETLEMEFNNKGKIINLEQVGA